MKLKELIDELTTTILRDAPYILVVDDKQGARAVLAKSVSDQGFKPIVAGSSAEAIEVASLAKPSGLLVDAIMDDKDNPRLGGALIDRIKSTYQENGGMPALVVTDAGDVEEVRRNTTSPVAPKNKMEAPLKTEILNKVRNKISRMLEEHFQGVLKSEENARRLVADLTSKIQWYERLTGLAVGGSTTPFTLTSRYQGTVTALARPENPNAAYVELTIDNAPVSRIFPIEQLQAAGIADEDTSVEYRIYQSGNFILSEIISADAPADDQTKLSQRTLDAFPEEEWRSIK